MRGYSIDYWDYPRKTNGATGELPAQEFATAVHDLDRLSEKVRRFYQTGDFEEVILNVRQIKELYQLCQRDEYSKTGRYTFHPELRANIEKKLDSLDYWWEAGVIAFHEIKISPEIAKAALTLSEEMRDFLISYVEYRGDDSRRASQVTSNRSSYETPSSKQPVVPLSPYPVKKGGLKIDNERLLYLSRPSILGCAMAYKRVLLLLVALLFGSFFVDSITNISLIAMLFRGLSVLLFLYVVGRTVVAVYSERYAIAEQNLCIEKGLVFKSTATIPLIRVETQKIEQSLLGKLLKTGNLVIKTHSGHVMALKRIYNPGEVFELVAELRKSKTFHRD
jgi:membrane protein YdbS with pleckstrin-like domain